LVQKINIGASPTDFFKKNGNASGDKENVYIMGTGSEA
jgi:hypothetical protein